MVRSSRLSVALIISISATWLRSVATRIVERSDRIGGPTSTHGHTGVPVIIPIILGLLVTACTAVAASQTKHGEIVIRFGGDCVLSDNYEYVVQSDSLRAFRDFSLFRSADLAMVNLECPVTTRGTRVEKPFNFRMRPGFLAALVEGGIDIVNIANNHIFDYDSTGLYDTIDHLDAVGLRHVGAGKNVLDAHAPVIYEVGGKRLAFLGYYGGGEAPAATQHRPGVAFRSLPLIQNDVRKAREEQKADYVFVNLHWGSEKEQVPDPDQITFAHRLIDAGVDVIVGHHPHVLQPVEEYNNGIIAYSLGNLIFGGNRRHTYDTALLEIRIAGGELTYAIRPVVVENWRAREMRGADARKFVRMVESLPLTKTN